jgi:hypothetical protein
MKLTATYLSRIVNTKYNQLKYLTIPNFLIGTTLNVVRISTDELLKFKTK